MPRPDFSSDYDQIHEIIRVNHAGEYGAKRIYQGQLKYTKDNHVLTDFLYKVANKEEFEGYTSPRTAAHIKVCEDSSLGATYKLPLEASYTRNLIKEMLEQELVHLNYFEKKLLEKKVRPTALLFLWHHLGFLLGCVSAKIGTKTSMLVTQSVEEVIEKHYKQQIDYLNDRNIEPELLENITQFRLDEIEHKDTAIENDSEQAIFATITSNLVKVICRIAIILSKKI
ncbi:MAG: demethoxyubiquinone hydroxylase family protein [Rickettsia endosymbiont of Pentastiridius leporinus]